MLHLALALASGCEEIPRTYGTPVQLGSLLFRDDFERDELGQADAGNESGNWFATGPGVSLREGRLRLEKAHNHPLWLRRPLGDDFQIELDAWAQSDEGDIKVEVAGDGKSHATSARYKASGYVLIFGGWNNALHVIARRDEHGSDRVTRSEPKVEAGRRYHFTIRRRGERLEWRVDGRAMLTMIDDAPLRGSGQQYFAFNGWEAPVEFDNLEIYGSTDAQAATNLEALPEASPSTRARP